MKKKLYETCEGEIIDNIYNDPQSVAFKKEEDKDGISN